MKLKYEAPTMDVKTYAQFENVFTYCNKNANKGCNDVSGSGNASDKPGGLDPSQTSAFSGGGSGGDGSGGGAGSGI